MRRAPASVDIFLVVPPSVYLGVLLATLTTFTFHAVVGGRRERSGLFYWPFGLAGFAGGALAAGLLGATYLVVGGLPLLGGIAGCVVGLLLAHLVLA